jgi:conjugal transfer/type IV secretion protein DotA/TraY
MRRSSIPLALLLATVVTFLLVASAHAQATNPGNPQALTWQQLQPGNDWSAQILNEIFPIGNAGANTQGIAAEQSVIGTIIGYLNGFVMLLAMAFVAYSSIVEIHRTAETGRILSQHFSSWAPVRLAFAAILMIPVSGGFSLGQAAVVKVAGWGIGMATTIYDAGIQAVGPQGLPIFTPEIPDTEPVVAGLIRNELCMALVNAAANATVIPAPTASTGTNYVAYNYSLAGSQTGAPACGSVVVKTASPSASSFTGVSFSMAADQKAALDYIIGADIRPAAEQAAKQYWTDRNSADFEPLWNTLTAATNDYVRLLTQDAATITQQLRAAKATQGNLDATVTQAEDLGWAGAGAYFWKIAQLNGDSLSYLGSVPVVAAPTYQGFGSSLASDLAPVIGAVNAFTSEIVTNAQTNDSTQPPTRIVGTSGSSGLLTTILNHLDINQILLNNFVNALEPTSEFWQDPFIVLVHTGDVMIGAAEAPIIGIGALKLAGGKNLWAAFMRNFTPEGVAASEASAVLNGGIIGRMIWWICMMLLIPGLFLAFVIPMIPLTMWLAGVASWFILVIEAIIAVPLWMFAHMTFQGEGIHGRGWYGYSLLFNVLFRPVLMLFGLIIGYWLFTIMSWLVFETFSLAADFVLQQGYILTNIFGVIVLTGMLVIIEMTFAIMAFRMISLLPYHVIQWIGFKPASRVDIDKFALDTTTGGTRNMLPEMQKGYEQLAGRAVQGLLPRGGSQNGGSMPYGGTPRLGGPGGGGGNSPTSGTGSGGAAGQADSTVNASTTVIPPAVPEG